MIKELRWVAITRVRRAATLGFALGIVLVTAPAAYGADGNPWHINIHRASSRLAAFTALSTASAAGNAGAGTPVSVPVTGTQTVIDEAAGTFAMHGSLVGTWYNTKFVPQYASSSQFVASGKELCPSASLVRASRDRRRPDPSTPKGRPWCLSVWLASAE